LDETEVAERVALIPDDQTAEVAQPGDEPRDRSGRSVHCAAVRGIHKMSLSTSQLLRHGRPRPSARRGSSPISGSSTVHRSSVKSMAAASSCWMQLTTHL
jgi:hypothetical protein